MVITGRAAFSRYRPSKSDWERVDQALLDLDIEHLRDRPYTELSGGERQLVMIARILVQAPKLFCSMSQPIISMFITSLI